MATQLDRIRYITEHYEQLHGLRLLPLSVPFLLGAWWELVPSTTPTAVSARAAELTLLVVAIAVSFPIRAYYHHRFGRVPALPWRSGLVPLLGQCALLVSAEVIREWAGWQFPVPLLVLAILLARIGLQVGHLRRHYLWLAGACIGAMILTPFHLSSNVRALEFDLLIAGGLITAAIGDDRVLRQGLTGTYTR
jgi:hypothetical protein